jgi:hypothetical protein
VSGPCLDLIALIRPLQLCADGGYQLKLGVLGVPLIMVPDKNRGTNFSLSNQTWPRTNSNRLKLAKRFITGHLMDKLIVGLTISC